MENKLLESTIAHFIGDSMYNEHSSNNVYSHLIGTSEILRKQGSSDVLQVAGALHNLYDTNVYKLKLERKPSRESVIDKVGPDVELRIYLFSKLNWSEFLSTDNFDDCVDFTKYFNGYAGVISREIFDEIVTLFFANIFEQWEVIPEKKKAFFRSRVAAHPKLLPPTSYLPKMMA